MGRADPASLKLAARLTAVQHGALSRLVFYGPCLRLGKATETRLVRLGLAVRVHAVLDGRLQWIDQLVATVAGFQYIEALLKQIRMLNTSSPSHVE